MSNGFFLARLPDAEVGFPFYTTSGASRCSRFQTTNCLLVRLRPAWWNMVLAAVLILFMFQGILGNADTRTESLTTQRLSTLFD